MRLLRYMEDEDVFLGFILSFFLAGILVLGDVKVWGGPPLCCLSRC